MAGFRSIGKIQACTSPPCDRRCLRRASEKFSESPNLNPIAGVSATGNTVTRIQKSIGGNHFNSKLICENGQNTLRKIHLARTQISVARSRNNADSSYHARLRLRAEKCVSGNEWSECTCRVAPFVPFVPFVPLVWERFFKTL
jgi:hypothetical protein